MKKIIKKKWVDALRSGEYKKATGALVKTKDDGTVKGYCCLGVLTDIYIKTRPKSRKWGEVAAYDDALLPKEVMAWAGIKQDNPEVMTPHGSDNLANLNDDGNYGFVRMAKLIEAKM